MRPDSVKAGDVERRRLSGWSEIAGHFNVAVSTVQRWEQREGLPVHHHRHFKRATPYAFTDELIAWEQRRAARSPFEATAVSQASDPARQQQSGLRFLACTSAGLIAVLHVVTILAEVAYSPAPFDAALGAATLGAAIAMGAAVLIALYADWRFTSRGRNGLWPAAAIVIVASAVVFAAMAPFLPAEPVVRARFQTFTGQSGYLKTAFGYGTPLILLFVLGPFHTVVRRQHAGAAGDAERRALRGRGGFPSPRVLGWLLAGAAIWSAGGIMHLFENLLPSPRMNLFMLLALLRVGVWLAIAALGVYWYAESLGAAE